MHKRCYLTACGLLCIVGVAEAGMPSASYTISEASKMRVETLSFFLAGFFLSAFCIKQLWNCLTKEFSILPRITYGKALALVSLWGLLFILVLTMISGARELMTPGAWQKNGATYQLTQPVRN